MNKLILLFISFLFLPLLGFLFVSQVQAAPPQCKPAKYCVTPTVVPTSTPTSVPGTGQQCATVIHDQYVTTGPDGKLYPTWHPAIDPVTGCYFGHEHGADPRTSLADSSMPAFGYIGSLIGDAEPHEGFKVFIVNTGYVSEGLSASYSYRIVFHMGTSGVKRYTTQFHSIEWDYLGPLGEFHVAGMADTGTANGSTCDLPRQGSKDFSTVGCNDPYEIWSYSFAVHDPADPYYAAAQSRYWVNGAVAAFDPVTTRNPQNNSEVIYTQTYRIDDGTDPLSAASQFRGCQREAYGGPTYARNSGKPTLYRTTVYGIVDPNGPLLQYVSAVNGDSIAFKYRQDFCNQYVHAPN